MAASEGNMKITILGVRGTAAVCGPKMLGFGGCTSCVLLRVGQETIVLDAGTGILNLKRELKPEESSLSLLLSHPHFDHMEGLPSCQVFYDAKRRIKIFAAEHNGLAPEAQLRRLMNPPLWPVGPESFTAQVSFHTVTGSFSLGEVRVKTMHGNHPGSCAVYRLECGDTSLVYATDFELDKESTPKLEAFARGCTILLCDGHYFEEEMESHRGYGHSCWKDAVMLAQQCGAQKLRIIHHAPWREDEELEAADIQLKQLFPNGAFARCGEEITI